VLSWHSVILWKYYTSFFDARQDGSALRYASPLLYFAIQCQSPHIIAFAYPRASMLCHRLASLCVATLRLCRSTHGLAFPYLRHATPCYTLALPNPSMPCLCFTKPNYAIPSPFLAVPYLCPTVQNHPVQYLGYAPRRYSMLYLRYAILHIAIPTRRCSTPRSALP
jgi:hypothetical protein